MFKASLERRIESQEFNKGVISFTIGIWSLLTFYSRDRLMAESLITYSNRKQDSVEGEVR